MNTVARAVVALSLLSLAGCPPPAMSTDAAVCIPGQRLVCECDGGARGQRECLPNSSLGACECPSIDGSAPPRDASVTDSAADAPFDGSMDGSMDASRSCSEGLSLCGDRCVATASDPAHCGACGAACALDGVSEQACVSARCEVVRCAEGRANCDGVAANGCETAITATDVNHCGGCGIRCSFANAGARCDSGACVMGACAPGFTDCDGVAANGCEVNTGTDNANCGACGTACDAGRVCSMGACAVTCGAGTTNCSGDCVRTTSDPNHCGACGTVCSLANVSVQACSASSCVVGACSAGFGNCDGVASNGCETAITATDVNHCGGCGVRCSFANASARCDSGACVMGACAPGFADCDGNPANGCEVNTGADNANCGACGAACDAGRVCSAGACAVTCGAGTTNCSGDCVRTTSDPNHCGACGTACSLANVSVQACSASSCVVGACSVGFGNCDGVAANGCETAITATDVNHCGGCGIRCSFANAGARCDSGSCAMGACAPGFADCDGNPANGCEVNTGADNANCGACGTACAAGRVCSMGACAVTCGAGTTNCSGDCVRTASDPNHCGACGSACALANVSVQACGASSCVVGACSAGFGNCDGVSANGCETNLRVDQEHCGACANRCGASATCVAGACVPHVCSPGAYSCVDPQHRERCNADGLATSAAPCAAMQSCVGAGTCVPWICTPMSATTCVSATARAVCDADGLGTTAIGCMIGQSCSMGTCAVRCGDGIIGAGESCDDSNMVNGDGCSSSCALEGEMVAGFSRGTGGSWMSQSAARAECRARGGDLAWIESAAQNTAVSSVCARTDGGPGPHRGCWIGGSHSGATNTWLNGVAWTYETWAPGEPSDPSSAVWIYSSPSPAPGRWDDTAATFMTSFVCRLPRSADSTGAVAVVNL